MDGLKISQMPAATPEDSDEIPIRRADQNKKVTFNSIKNAILSAMASLLDGYSPVSHNHDASYEPKNSNIQGHISNSDIHVTTTDKSSWNAKANKLAQVDLGIISSSTLNISLAQNAVQKVEITADVEINFDGLVAGNATFNILQIKNSSTKQITFNSTIPEACFINFNEISKHSENILLEIFSYNEQKTNLAVSYIADIFTISLNFEIAKTYNFICPAKMVILASENSDATATVTIKKGGVDYVYGSPLLKFDVLEITTDKPLLLNLISAYK